MKNDVVIIGSGLGGLECANILSREGLRVLVLERNAQPGGCMQSYRRHGLTYDTGLHYVGGLSEGQSLHAAFKYLGLLDLPWKRLDKNFDSVTIGHRTFALAQGYDDFAATLATEFPAEREGLEAYARLLEHTNRHQLDAFAPGKEEANAPDPTLSTGAWQYLNETLRDPLLIDVVSGASLKMELNKDTLPLFTFTHGNGSFVESSWRLRGDGALLVGALVRGIRSHGGEVVCLAEVTRLCEENGRIVRALCSDGNEYEGEAFVSNAHPAVTCGLLEPGGAIGRLYPKRIAQLENTFGMFTLSLRLKKNTLPYLNHNAYVYERPDVWALHQTNQPVGCVLVSFRVPEDDSPYARQVDLLTPVHWNRFLPWAGTHVGRRGSDYTALKERLKGECLALAERAVPGLTDSVEECHTSTPLTWRDYTLTPCGSAYGIRKDFATLTTMLSSRTPLRNLFLTGQSLMLHGVHGTTITAFFTCAELIGRKRVWEILND